MWKLYKGVNTEKQVSWEWCPHQRPLRASEKEARKLSRKTEQTPNTSVRGEINPS